MPHRHDYGQAWPFAGAENEAAICCRHVLESRPILRVTHDAEDGGWQFLCGAGGHGDEDGRVVCLGCVVSRDTTLLPLSDLPEGWFAERETVTAAWKREVNPR